MKFRVIWLRSQLTLFDILKNVKWKGGVGFLRFVMSKKTTWMFVNFSCSFSHESIYTLALQDESNKIRYFPFLLYLFSHTINSTKLQWFKLVDYIFMSSEWNYIVILLLDVCFCVFYKYFLLFNKDVTMMTTEPKHILKTYKPETVPAWLQQNYLCQASLALLDLPYCHLYGYYVTKVLNVCLKRKASFCTKYDFFLNESISKAQWHSYVRENIYKWTQSLVLLQKCRFPPIK